VRRVLRHQFERLLSREAAVRAGEDVEDIHQLRVATRRLRASLQVVAPCFDQRAIRRFRRGLRRLAAALGAVRDRDVFLEHLRHTQDALPAAEREQLTRLQVSVAEERVTARQALLVRLDSPRYARFKEAFATFLSTPGAGVGPLPATGQPLRVRDLAGSLLWGRYKALRAFEPVLLAGEEVIQHEARIAGKRLRYTIECFAEAIGGAADALLEPLAGLQETLGTLQDEVTARSTIESLHLRDDPGAEAYLAQRRTEREAALAAFPKHWARVMGPAYRGQLLAVLEAF
jgi:CHAD domain-containing protein